MEQREDEDVVYRSVNVSNLHFPVLLYLPFHHTHHTLPATPHIAFPPSLDASILPELRSFSRVPDTAAAGVCIRSPLPGQALWIESMPSCHRLAECDRHYAFRGTACC